MYNKGVCVGGMRWRVRGNLGEGVTVGVCLEKHLCCVEEGV